MYKAILILKRIHLREILTGVFEKFIYITFPFFLYFPLYPFVTNFFPFSSSLFLLKKYVISFN